MKRTIMLIVSVAVAMCAGSAIAQTDYDVTVDVGQPGDVFSFKQIEFPELVGRAYNGDTLTLDISFANNLSLVHSNNDGISVGIRLGTSLPPGGSAQTFPTQGFITDPAGNPARPTEFIVGELVSAGGLFASYGLGFDPRPEPTQFSGLSLVFDLPTNGVNGFIAPNVTSATLRLIGEDEANGIFTVTAIPEPSSLALLGLGGLLVTRRRRR